MHTCVRLFNSSTTRSATSRAQYGVNPRGSEIIRGLSRPRERRKKVAISTRDKIEDEKGGEGSDGVSSCQGSICKFFVKKPLHRRYSTETRVQYLELTTQNRMLRLLSVCNGGPSLPSISTLIVRRIPISLEPMPVSAPHKAITARMAGGASMGVVMRQEVQLMGHSPCSEFVSLSA